MNLRLGKKAPRLDHRTLRLASFMTPALPPAPPAVDWTRGMTDWGMLGNDVIGDCTIASVGHAVQLYAVNSWQADPAKARTVVTDEMVKSCYEKWCGYVPGDPSTDNGGVELDVLKAWRRDGFAGHQLLAWADTDPGHVEHVKQSIAIFGCAYVGLGLPLTAQAQLGVGVAWDVAVASGVATDPGDCSADKYSWGGHAVILVAYDAVGPTCVTWGKLQKMTWAWFARYCDESHALLHRGWVSHRGGFPPGFDASRLEADLRAVSG